jgi:two-component system, chemotaxis family, chemotaxis protein CheY
MGKNRRVLVVDNHEGFRRSIRKYLEIEGWDVLEAEGGAEALVMLRSEAVDVVLTDLNMPQMSGIDLIFSIRSNAALDHVLVFVLSVTRSDERVNEAIDAGANGHLQKPFDFDNFQARLQDFAGAEPKS